MTPARRRPGSGLATKIANSGLSIYDALDERPDLFYDIASLEEQLASELAGLTFSFPLRTRSKVVKQAVCQALGYPVPTSFRRIRPRIPGQDLDVYVQKAGNLQIWNEQVSPSRRYAVVRLDEHDSVVAVRVITGEGLAKLDRTGTLTQKYQAKRRVGKEDFFRQFHRFRGRVRNMKLQIALPRDFFRKAE